MRERADRYAAHERAWVGDVTAQAIGLTDHDRDVRRHRIGASEVAAVLGISPYAAPWDVYGRIVCGIERESAPELVAGTFLERACLDYYEAFYKHDAAVLKRSPGSTPHALHTWLSATPDALLLLDPRGWWGVEAKTERRRENWGEPGTDQVPVHVAAQTQVQCATLGLQGVDVVVLFKALDVFSCYTVPRDEEVIDKIVADVGAWHARHIIGGVMPDLDGGSAAAAYLRQRYKGGGSYVTATPEQAELVKAYAGEKAAEKALAKRIAVLKQQIVIALGDADGFEGACSYKADKRGTRRLLLTGEKE